MFHPKVWALRFVAEDSPVLYRLLCLSRNLTFDRSWDTVLILEGKHRDKQNAYSTNHPLGDFFAALPRLAVHPLPERVQETIELMQYELRRVRFEPPEGFDSISFWPLGLRRWQWPFGGRVDRMLVVSPFASDGLLTRLPGKDGGVLVSRPDTLEDLKATSLEAFENTYALRQEAEPEEDGEEEPTEDVGESEGEEMIEEDAEESLTGFHAKLYVADAGWDASVWTGSANATNAAFNSNVEFLVELTGRKSLCGVDALMKQSGDATSFADLLQEFAPSEDAPKVDPVAKQLEESADGARRILAESGFTATVTDSSEENELFRMQLEIQAETALELPPGVSVRCWPISLPITAAVPMFSEAEGLAFFGPLSFERLTSFFAFEARAASGETSVARRFAEIKMPGLNAGSVEAAMRVVAGTARSMGIKVAA